MFGREHKKSASEWVSTGCDNDDNTTYWVAGKAKGGPVNELTVDVLTAPINFIHT